VSDRLRGILLKLDRADDHLNALYEEFASVLDAHGAGFFAPVEFDAQTGWHVSKVGEFGEAGPRISILAGEVAHQLRSALDHLAWQLVEANQQTLNEHTAFPVRRAPFSNGRSFVRTTTRGGTLQGVPPAAARLIEEAQPYHAAHPERHWLAVLDGLWQADKHRLLLTSYIATSSPSKLASLYSTDWPVTIEKVRVALKRGQRVEADAEIARLRLAAPDPVKAKVKVDGRVTFRIEVSEAPGGPVANFDLISRRTRALVRRFAPYL
jgi:hypothetical protein